MLKNETAFRLNDQVYINVTPYLVETCYAIWTNSFNFKSFSTTKSNTAIYQAIEKH